MDCEVPPSYHGDVVATTKKGNRPRARAAKYRRFPCGMTRKIEQATGMMQQQRRNFCEMERAWDIAGSLLNEVAVRRDGEGEGLRVTGFFAVAA
jgi:hypothetical protein